MVEEGAKLCLYNLGVFSATESNTYASQHFFFFFFVYLCLFIYLYIYLFEYFYKAELSNVKSYKALWAQSFILGFAYQPGESQLCFVLFYSVYASGSIPMDFLHIVRW